MTSKYLENFQSLTKSGFRLKGSYLLVEYIPEPEKKTASGIILDVQGTQNSIITNATTVSQKPQFYRVIMAGEGYDDEDGNKDQSQLDCQVGSIILISPMSVKSFQYFHSFEDYDPDTLGLTMDSEAQMIFKTEDDFNKFFEELNA